MKKQLTLEEKWAIDEDEIIIKKPKLKDIVKEVMLLGKNIKKPKQTKVPMNNKGPKQVKGKPKA